MNSTVDMILELHFKRIIILSLFSVSVFFLRFTSIQCAEVHPSDIKDINSKIDQQRIAVEKVTKSELLIIEKLDQIEKQYLRENNEIDNLTTRIDALQNQINESKSSIDKINSEKTMRDAFLSQRLNAIYKYYRQGLFKIILSSPSYAVFIRQEKLISDVLRSDYDLVQNCQKTLDKYNAYQTDLTIKKEMLVTAKMNLAHHRDKVKESLHEKVDLLDKIKHEKSLQLAALDELEKLSRDLQIFVEKLPEKNDHPGSTPYTFSMLKGKLRTPVKGTLVSNFGRREYPDLHTSTFQKGIEIECPHGTEIKAIFNGKVVYADWFKGYGLMMIIDHGEGYFSLFAHASKLLKRINDQVIEGETVALVGDTNSIKGACLYFEIRHHGNPQDPLRWLNHDFS